MPTDSCRDAVYPDASRNVATPWAVHMSLEALSRRQRDQVVASQRDGFGLALLAMLCARCRTCAQRPIGFGHLSQRDRVVERRDGNVATVNDTGPAAVGVELHVGIEAARGYVAGGSAAYGPRAHAGTCWEEVRNVFGSGPRAAAN